MNQPSHQPPTSGKSYETQEFNFRALIWAVPIGMVLLVVYVAICWVGAKKSLNGEMAKKQFQSMEADSAGTTAQ